MLDIAGSTHNRLQPLVLIRRCPFAHAPYVPGTLVLPYSPCIVVLVEPPRLPLELMRSKELLVAAWLEVEREEQALRVHLAEKRWVVDNVRWGAGEGGWCGRGVACLVTLPFRVRQLRTGAAARK